MLLATVMGVQLGVVRVRRGPSFWTLVEKSRGGGDDGHRSPFRASTARVIAVHVLFQSLIAMRRVTQRGCMEVRRVQRVASACWPLHFEPYSLVGSR